MPHRPPNLGYGGHPSGALTALKLRKGKNRFSPEGKTGVSLGL